MCSRDSVANPTKVVLKDRSSRPPSLVCLDDVTAEIIDVFKGRTDINLIVIDSVRKLAVLQ